MGRSRGVFGGEVAEADEEDESAVEVVIGVVVLGVGAFQGPFDYFDGAVDSFGWVLSFEGEVFGPAVGVVGVESVEHAGEDGEGFGWGGGAGSAAHERTPQHGPVPKAWALVRVATRTSTRFGRMNQPGPLDGPGWL